MSEQLVLAKGEAMRIVEKNDKGNVTYRRRYKTGDVVDTAHIDDARVQALVDDGVLVPKSEYEGGAGAATTYAEGSGDPTGDAAVGAAGAGTQGTAEAPTEGDEGEGDGTEADEAPDYADLDYAALKAEIDSRNEDRNETTAISKQGSADDLRARLVADDAAQADNA